MTSHKLEPTPQPPAAVLTTSSVDVDGDAHPERPCTEQIEAPAASITQVVRDAELDQPSVTKAPLIGASHSDEPHPGRVETLVTSETTGLVSDAKSNGVSTTVQQNLVTKDSTAVPGRSRKLSHKPNPGPKHTSSHTWRIVRFAETISEARDVGKRKRKRDHDGEQEQVGDVLEKKPRIDHASVNESFEGGADHPDLALSSLESMFLALTLTPTRRSRAPAHATYQVQDAEKLQFNYCNDVPNIPIPTRLDVLELERQVAEAQDEHRRAKQRRRYAETKARKASKATSAGPRKADSGVLSRAVEDCPKVQHAKRAEIHYHNLWRELYYQVPERRRQYGKWVREQRKRITHPRLGGIS